MKKATILTGCFFVAALFSTSCGGDKEEEAPPQSAFSYQGNAQYGQQQPNGQQPPPGQSPYGPQQQYPQQQPGQQPAGQQQPAPGQSPALGNILADPQGLQNILAGALAAGAASLSPMTGGELAPIEQGIKMRVPNEAKGMKPDGQLMSAKLSPDGHAEGSFTIQPGGCYTVIGFGGMGVFEYQINVLTAPPMPPQVLAQSNAGGATPTVGPNDQCLRSPAGLPMPVKIDMHVVRGQGLVGAQVYKK